MLIICHSCNSKIRVPDKAAGKRVKCPKCATLLTVPAADPAPGPDPETAGVSTTPLPPAPATDSPAEEPAASSDEAAENTIGTEVCESKPGAQTASAQKVRR